MNIHRPRVWLGFLLISLSLNTHTIASEHSSLSFRISGGASIQERNKVQVPNDSTGTRFSLADIAGDDPLPALRFEGFWTFREKHAVRFLLAPLSYTETGEIDTPVDFAGHSFSVNSTVEASYTFNSIRVGYRYHWRDRPDWDIWLGATLKVRDAEIRLEQNNVVASDDDLGLVPLLYLAGEYRFGQKWSASFDLDALAGGPGRAIDAGIGLDYRFSRSWRAGVQIRALEGGADVDSVYNFAWFNSALLTLSYGF